MKTPRATSVRGQLVLIALTCMVWPALGSTARSATVEIDGVIVPGVGVQWTSKGQPASAVALNPGDTVVWKAVSGTHGVVFDTESAAEAVLQFQAGGGLPPLGPQTVKGELVWGTAPQPPVGAGTLLAQATVKPGTAPGTKLGFFCSSKAAPPLTTAVAMLVPLSVK